MALTDVGLNYVSANAAQFIKDADNATNAVTRFNYTLANGNSAFVYEKNIARLSSANKQFVSSTEDLTSSTQSATRSFQVASTSNAQYANSLQKTSNLTQILNQSTVKAWNVIQNNAKDADTASQSIDVLGDKLNRVENAARISAIGIGVFGRALGVPVKLLKVVNKGLDEFADKTDFVSDTFGKVADKVDKADGEIRDYNEEQGKTPKLIEKVGIAFSENLPEIAAGTVEVAKFGNSIRGLFEKDKGLKLPPFLITIATNFAKLPPPIQAAVVAFGAFKVASAFLEFFGTRAAGLNAIANSFEKLRSSANLSVDWIDKFAESADNQLTQAELLTLSNKALAGSFGDFQSELAASLPQLLEFARVRAAATGEDSGFLFQSLIEGIKKQEPEILDNLGLVVKLDEVYRTYAGTLNKTVEQLTAVEKQQAILSRVNSEAARNIGILGEATLSNADRMEARKNVISDILDNVSLSFQPLLAVFLDIELFFIRLGSSIIKPVASFLTSVFTIWAALFTSVFEKIKPVFELIATLIRLIIAPFEAMARILAKLLPIVFDLWGWFSPMGLAIKFIGAAIRFVNPLLESLIFLFQTIADLVIGLISFLQYLSNIIGGVISQALSPFINMLSNLGFNLESIKITITQLAAIIAFGFGKAVASLVNVFAGAAKNILTIVADLAQGIADFLIGQSPPPKGPLSKIDEGGKATFEAWLDGFTGLSLKPVEQVAGEVNTTLGNIGKLSLPQVENRIKKLDKALRPFEEQLAIVQSRFEAIQKPAEAALNAIDRQLDKAVEALTKGDETALNSVKALDAQRASILKNLEMQQQQVDFAQIQLALKQAQQSEERTLLEIQKKRLDGQQLTTKELKKEKDILSKNADSIANAGGSGGSGTPTSGGIPSAQTATTGNQFGDFAMQGFASEIDLDNFSAIGEQQTRLASEGARIGEGLAGLPDRFGNAFEGIFGEEGTIATMIDGVFGEDGFFATKITEFLSDTGPLKTGFEALFGESGYIRSIWGSIFGQEGFLLTSFNGLFGEEGIIGIILGTWFGVGGFLDRQLDAGSQLFTDMYNAVFGENGVFSGVANALETLVKTPLLAVLNTIEMLINSFISYAESFLNGIIDSVEGLVEYIPTELRGSLNDLIGYQLTIPRVDFNPPAAAKGGMFTGGLMQVGEKGREYIAPANKIGVFPNNFVTAIESLETVLMSYMNIPSGSGYGSVSNTSNNNNNSQVININQPTSMQTVRQQLSLMG